MNAFIITIDDNPLIYNESKFHLTLTKEISIKSWWHYIPSVYIVTSEANSEVLANQITFSYPGLKFLIAKLDLTDVNGVLPKGAWDWISNNNNKKVELTRVSNMPAKEQNLNMIEWLHEVTSAAEKAKKTEEEKGMKALADFLKKGINK